MSIERIIVGAAASVIVGIVLVVSLAIMALVLGGIAMFLPSLFILCVLVAGIVYFWYGVTLVWEWIRDRFH